MKILCFIVFFRRQGSFFFGKGVTMYRLFNLISLYVALFLYGAAIFFQEVLYG